MDFAFKIFGAPHIFDLYQGNENGIRYFQTFDNGSIENVKLTIHRMARGQVSYSYLRYNLISGGNRTGAFFGMSLIFKNEYCFDVEYLYELFEMVYKDILQKKVLIEEVKGNPNAQAKYLVQNFADADSEVRRIGNIVSKNIENECTNDIHPLDSSFKQGNSNLIRRLNTKNGNGAFLKALRNYSWVSISPDYDDEEYLSPEAIADLDERIDKVQKNITTISINLVKGNDARGDIKSEANQIKNDQNLIEKYLNFQTELQGSYKKLNGLQNQLEDLHKVVSAKTETISSSIQQSQKENRQGYASTGKNVKLKDVKGKREEETFQEENDIENNEGDKKPKNVDGKEENGANGKVGSFLKIIIGSFLKIISKWFFEENETRISDGKVKPDVYSITRNKYILEKETNDGIKSLPKPPTPLFNVWQRYKLYILATVTMLVIVLLWYGAGKPYSNEIKDTSEIKRIENPVPTPEDNTAILVNQGNMALQNNNFDTAIEKFKLAGKTELVENAKAQAKEHWNGKAAETKILAEQEAYLENVKKYGGYPSTDKDIADVQEKIKAKQKEADRQREIKTNTKSKRESDLKVNINIINKKTGKAVTGSEYSIGDELEVTVNMNGNALSNGTWSYENNNIEVSDKSSNPINVKMIKEGTCGLFYKINGEEKSSIHFIIKRKQASFD